MSKDELEYDENGIPLWLKLVNLDPHDSIEPWLNNKKNEDN